MSSLPSTTGKDEGRFGFHEIVERDGKKVPIASNTDIAIKLLVVAPIWATLVLPLTIAYQAGKSVLGLVRGSPALPEEQSENASGDDGPVLVVDPGDVIPRTDRKHDVVVLGATGFTGGLAVRHLAKTYGTGNGGRVRWAIAGRSEPKLKAVLERLANELEMPELAGDGAVDIILCDTSDSSTLPGLVRNTRSVATTAGPFSLYGKGVVEHCAKFGTHYADITGETSFVKSMKSKHQDAAVESGARILSLCGNDCVPWDLSYNLLADEFAARFGSESMESVEFGNEFSSSASGGTLKTMCMGMDGRLEQIDEKDQNILRRAFGSETEHEAPMENGISFGIRSGVPKPWMLGAVSGGSNKDTEDSSLVEAPFVMSGVNYESVGWSHALRRDPKCSYKEQLLLPDYKSALDGVLGLVLFFTSLLNPLTLGLLENYLVTQPGDGPGMTEMEEDFFLAVTGTARGTKGTLVQSLLYYNKDPGYLETARMVVECALCLALEEEAVSKNIAEASPEAAAKSNDDDTVGGFFTPGFALRKNLLKRLVDTGCHYELRVVEEADETSSSSVSQTAGSAGTEREQPTAL
eukprot:CAMPEP_0201121772 /NCGR_PEP_ID=MMETSP0850-20130426/5584_1 /ASSEMBLY_ACC=CAM_ASM_000622 /TAXON_ID=183588 /ORGANISM="Pseudo-nitzschia fraudulenta, Strain WWA7" /LENGTH=578 /DNA_ID=CAMNT_0047388323 /DNA_START=326 /DNA_END=2062 /DNA_ORIENTATION=+